MRAIARFLLMAIGLALALSGGLWALQGLGLVMWPASSFMLAQREWAVIGTVTCVFGIGLLMAGNRMHRN